MKSTQELRIGFEFTEGSAELSNIAKAKLDEAALRLKEDPEVRAQIIGYNAPGGDGEDPSLGEKRAQAAKDFLVSRHGIDPARIEIEVRTGPSGDPILDRRAEVILTVP